MASCFHLGGGGAGGGTPAVEAAGSEDKLAFTRPHSRMAWLIILPITLPFVIHCVCTQVLSQPELHACVALLLICGRKKKSH